MKSASAQDEPAPDREQASSEKASQTRKQDRRDEVDYVAVSGLQGTTIVSPPAMGGMSHWVTGALLPLSTLFSLTGMLCI